MTCPLKAAAPPIRRSILRALRERELDVAALGERAALPTAQLVPHLEALRQAGLLRLRHDGAQPLYRLDAERAGEIASFLRIVTRPM